MKLDKNAPVTYAANIEVNAPIGRVWQLVSAIEHWPEWNNDIKSARVNGRLEPGATFVWKSGPGTITSTLIAVEERSLIAWSGRTMGIKAVHIWRLKESSGGTLVTTEESWDGLPARILKSYGKKTLIRSIDSGLQMLKQAAENT